MNLLVGDPSHNLRQRPAVAKEARVCSAQNSEHHKGPRDWGQLHKHTDTLNQNIHKHNCPEL